MTHNLIIIGSGPAGLTAGIYAGRANLSPLIIEGNSPGGQLMGTTDIENWPGEPSIFGPQLMLNMKEHAQKMGAECVSDAVSRVNFLTYPFIIDTEQGHSYTSKAVIIATGAKPHRLGCPGEDIYWGKGVTTCAVCDGAFYPNKQVVIVGGGDTAMEEASFMTKFTNKITIIQNTSQLTASHAMQQRVLNNPAIKIIYSSTVTNVFGDGNHLTSIEVTHLPTKKTQTIATDGMFVAIGIKPNTELFKNQISLDQYGYIKVTEQTKTSVEGVFSAGDVADYRYRQAITSAGSGCMAALDAERFLASKK